MLLRNQASIMARKVSVSVSLEPEQADWLDAQDESNSSLVREWIDRERGEE